MNNCPGTERGRGCGAVRGDAESIWWVISFLLFHGERAYKEGRRAGGRKETRRGSPAVFITNFSGAAQPPTTILRI